MPTDSITPGATYTRGESPLRYQVEDVRPDTTDWATTHRVGPLVVNYVQLDEGDYAAGSRWACEEETFKQEFTQLAPPENS